MKPASKNKSQAKPPAVSKKSSTSASKAGVLAPPAAARLTSLDAYRGAIMLLMASAGFGLADIAKAHPDSGFLGFLGYQADHAAWRYGGLWDMIQPAFMFMVGVALPWSVANRTARGESFDTMFLHALWRGLLLVLLAVFLSSASSKQTDWIFTNVLAQIGLGYPFLFVLAFKSNRTVWLAAEGILIFYWAAFAFFPLPAADLDRSLVGVPADWPLLQGFEAHWNKNTNFASNFDQWFLNLFPRETPFVFNKGGYATLNFIPSLATMIFGLLTGRLLRQEISIDEKLKQLFRFGVAAIALGLAIDLVGLCPLVKRIWTPSWAIYSTGWVLLMLAGFMAVIDRAGYQRWAFPLIVVGLNPLTMYVLFQLSSGWIKQQTRTHFGQGIFQSWGPTYVAFLERGMVLFGIWLVVYWMYRRKIFVRL
jgi:heparan-alpha-glucosaminide N-acetyltransferase